MDGWTELRDDDDDGGGDDEGKFGVAFNLDFHIEKVRFDSCKESLRSLFDQVLVASMREMSIGKCVRPTPVLLGDGRPVDLFKLYWIVRKIGGYDIVSRNNLWGFVLEECGLGFGVIPSIKLIYVKYLNELDRWLRRVFGKRLFEGGYTGLVQNLDLLSQELETRFRGMLSDKKKRNNDSEFWKCTKGRGDVPLDISESELHISPHGRTNEQVENRKKKPKKNEKLLSVNDHSRLSPGRTAETIISEERGDVDRSVYNEFAATAKRVVEEAMYEANGFSRGLVDDESRKSCKEGGGKIIASAKEVTEKVINKVLHRGETIGAATDNDVDTEKFSVFDKADICISAKEAVEEFLCKTHDLSDVNIDDKERFTAQQGIDNMVQRSDNIENVLESRKRKRLSQSFAGMLNWLIHVAKHSDDPSVGLIPECSKWSDYGNEEFWVQAMLVREALLIRRHAKTNASENLVKDQLKKPRMHPSMYEDNVLDPQSTEKQRSTKRIPSLKKPFLCPCCKSSAAHQSKEITHKEREVSKNSLDSQVNLVPTDLDELPAYLNHHDSSDFPRRQVSVGPPFQAEVPEWTGMLSESDPKWLGKRTWPPEDGEKNSFKLYGVGKGRQHICDCPFPNSVECVRFHIAEKRLMLKHELGLLFYQWRFNHMGEEVSLSWTEEEEKIFKEMMRSYPAFSNEFWWNAPKFLPSKTRKTLVSYYFNVFLVQRRSYQNRVTPEDIDSDDDEKECGNIGTGFGYNALYIRGSSSITCTLNKESTELL